MQHSDCSEKVATAYALGFQSTFVWASFVGMPFPFPLSFPLFHVNIFTPSLTLTNTHHLEQQMT